MGCGKTRLQELSVWRRDGDRQEDPGAQMMVQSRGRNLFEQVSAMGLSEAMSLDAILSEEARLFSPGGEQDLGRVEMIRRAEGPEQLSDPIQIPDRRVHEERLNAIKAGAEESKFKGAEIRSELLGGHPAVKVVREACFCFGRGLRVDDERLFGQHQKVARRHGRRVHEVAGEPPE